MHNPLYSISQWGADPSMNGVALLLRKQLQGVFAQYGVDIVLQGHDHCVSRTYPIDGQGNAQLEKWQTENGVSYSVDPNGVIYMMEGTAGGKTYNVVAVDSKLYMYAKKSKPASWAEFTFSGDTLTIVVKYGEEEQLYETWGIKKTK